MTPLSSERIYALLPTLYQQRDAQHGSPLRALLGVMEAELGALEDDIDGLYENWFIETCAEWVVPYLGDLLGVSQLSDDKHLLFSQRARVANTLRYRRRKGTIKALQDVVQDATGWRGRAVEFYERLAVTQHAQHSRPNRGATIDLRDRAAIERMGSPVDAIARRVDVRRIASGRGTHGLANVGVFVSRLQSYPLTHAAQPVPGDPPGRFTFDPLSRDLALFPGTRLHIVRGAASLDGGLPLPLNRRLFAEDLATGESAYYGPHLSLAIIKDGRLVPPSAVSSSDLVAWTRPRSGVAIDVQRGRFAFAPGEEPATGVVVSYCYGFTADLGGGPYDRRASLADAGPDWWHAQVTADATRTSPSSVPVFATITAAVAEWTGTGRPGLIEVLDSEGYDLPRLELPTPRALIIQAADGTRPTVRDRSVELRGPASAASTTSRQTLQLNGFVFAGGIRCGGRLQVTLSHCSVPGEITEESADTDLRLHASRCVLGPLRLPSAGRRVDVRDSLVDGSVTASVLALTRATVFGPVSAQEVDVVSESILVQPIVVERPQTGAMRFTFVPPGSTTPKRFRCQPDLALAETNALEQAQIVRRLVPTFTSQRFGDAGYGQLRTDCALEISAGAEDGSEMGAFHHLHQPQRAATLRAVIEEYLPLGLEAGVIVVA